MKLWPALSNDPEVAGFVVEWPSGKRQSVAWRSRVPILPTIDAAKQYATKLIEARGREPGGIDDLERTNWPSVVAAIQRLIGDWNEQTKAAIYESGDAQTTHDSRPERTMLQ